MLAFTSEYKEILRRFSRSNWENVSLPANTFAFGNGLKAEMLMAAEMSNRHYGSYATQNRNAYYKW